MCPRGARAGGKRACVARAQILFARMHAGALRLLAHSMWAFVRSPRLAGCRTLRGLRSARDAAPRSRASPRHERRRRKKRGGRREERGGRRISLQTALTRVPAFPRVLGRGRGGGKVSARGRGETGPARWHERKLSVCRVFIFKDTGVQPHLSVGLTSVRQKGGLPSHGIHCRCSRANHYECVCMNVFCPSRRTPACARTGNGAGVRPRPVLMRLASHAGGAGEGAVELSLSSLSPFVPSEQLALASAAPRISDHFE